MDKWYPLKAVHQKQKREKQKKKKTIPFRKNLPGLLPKCFNWILTLGQLYLFLFYLKKIKKKIITSLQAYWILMLLSFFSVLYYSFHWEPLGSTVKLFSHAWEEGGLQWSFFDEYRLKIILASHDHSRAAAELSLSKTSLAGNQTRLSSFAIVICPFFQGLPIGSITPSQQRIESDPERALCFQVGYFLKGIVYFFFVFLSVQTAFKGYCLPTSCKSTQCTWSSSSKRACYSLVQLDLVLSLL